MQSFKDTNSSILVLKKGEDLMETLNAYALETNLQSAWVNIIGSSSQLTLAFYDKDKREYQSQDFDEPLEIIGLQGNLAYMDGRPFWHIHGTFSRADYSVIGGHVKSCTIGLTGEVFIQNHIQKLHRQFDDETGLNLLTS